jgi:ubiquinone/menaquinone biosynthesis C-methylase UbiE
MPFNQLKSNVKIIDSVFDVIYSDRIKAIAEQHFTPVNVSKIAARYLADKRGVKILDIGSGAGKFCMIGSACTTGHFTGVELRSSLSLTAQSIAQQYNLTNVVFINSNITSISFKEYEAFYFYNSFYENVKFIEKMDDEIEIKRELYDEYSLYVKNQLEEMPIGTKLATYYSFLKEIPDSYKIQHTAFGDKLKMWKKIH